MTANRFERIWCEVLLCMFALAYVLTMVMAGVAIKERDWIGAVGSFLVMAFFLFGVFVYRSRIDVLRAASEIDPGKE